MRKFKLLSILFCLLPIFDASAQNALPPSADNHKKLVEKYSAQGISSAKKLKAQFEALDKPAFQKAYGNYLNDLKIISKTGTAPDNQALYNDLLKMNSEKEFIYKIRKGSIRTGFGHIMGE